MGHTSQAILRMAAVPPMQGKGEPKRLPGVQGAADHIDTNRQTTNTMSYKIGVQKTATGQFRVVLYSVDNGKLVMQGEAMKNRKDADVIADSVFTLSDEMDFEAKLIPASKKWPRNAGPKKRKPAKK